MFARHKFFFTVSLCAAIFNNSFSQYVPKRFEISIGGSAVDLFRDGAQLSNGNYVSVGSTSSSNGDIQNSYGNGDFLLACTSPLGQKLWVKTIGGSERDSPGWEGSSESISPATDGGFYFAGSTASNNGDISGNHGGQDIFVGKFDSDGNAIWKKCLGGTLTDLAGDIAATPDGGCIVIGAVVSNNDGNVPAHSSAPNTTEVWVIKLNSVGIIEWSKTFGGSNSDTGYSIEVSQEGGYIFTSNTTSTDGDTAPTFDSNQFAKNDIWVVKLTESGIIDWQKRFGGLDDDEAAVVIQANNGDYYIWCSTRSTNGDFIPNEGLYDFALVRLKQDGTVVFKKTLGGASWDSHGNIVQTADGNFIAQGSTYSFDINGIRTYKVVEPTCILMRISAEDGTLNRVTALSDASMQSYSRMILNRNNELVGFGAKDSPDHSNREALVTSFANYNKITGIVFNDLNGNGVKDATESEINGVTVESVKREVLISTSTTNQGPYSNDAEIGRTVTAVKRVKPDYFAVNPDSLITILTDYNLVVTQNFGIKLIPNISDLKVVMLPVSANRAGQHAIYRVVISNIGTETVQNGRLRFIKDRRSSFVSSLPNGSYLNDTLSIEFTNLKIFDTLQAQITLLNGVPPLLNGGDWMTHKVLVEPISEDKDPSDNQFQLRRLVTGPLDPNDKTEAHGDRYSVDAGVLRAPLTYTIRFQNVGTDTAFRIVVRDTLDPKLDPNSINMLATSFPSSLKVEGNICVWTFDGINLPDSNRNEPGSHGYISFSVRPKTALNLGDVVQNSASIYFDFEVPVKTNTYVTTVTSNLPAPPIPEIPEPVTTICTNSGLTTYKIANIPPPSQEATVTVLINGIELILNNDSTFQLSPNQLTTGINDLRIQFKNYTGTTEKAIEIHLQNVTEPNVDLVSNHTTVNDSYLTVELTAIPLSGQGSNPRYLISRDKDFLDILKPDGPTPGILLPVSSMDIGRNMFYVRMESNSPCVSTHSAVDSVLVTREKGSGNNNYVFQVSPNPFGDELQIKCSIPEVPLTIVIHDVDGKQVFRNNFVNQTLINIRNNFARGLYLISFYLINGKLISVLKAYKM